LRVDPQHGLSADGRKLTALVLIPADEEEWNLLMSIKNLNPMLPGVGSALFLTAAPYTEPVADSPREATSGTALRIVECTPSPAA